MKMKLRPHYSGDLSNPFWKQVWAVKEKTKDEKLHDELYTLGCALQNVEWAVLRRLEAVSEWYAVGHKAQKRN